MQANDLPIYKHSEEILSALSTGNRLLLNAPTGSGKSTGIPPLLFNNDAIEGRIIIVEPRRLAARLLAERVAQTLGVSLGKEVGYSVRFDARFSADTKILFLTDGVLQRQLLENPSLDGVGLVVFDEFHERRIASDIALGYCKDLQESKRADLKLIVMSATLATESLEDYLSPCKKVNAEGKAYPVEISYRAPRPIPSRSGRPELPPVWDQIKDLSKEVSLEKDNGNWLIFQPGVHEIRKTIEALSHASWLKDYRIFPLYSSLPPRQQLEAIESTERKIIVSTNVAETSLTINGIRTVIDTGVARESRYDPARDMDSLLLRKISQASATQRAGRAGRTASGTCYRLWSESDHAKREPFTLAESLTVDLAPSLLFLSSLGYRKEREFNWLDHPPKETLERAKGLLASLGALSASGELTEIGQALTRMPLPPRLARLILAGEELDCLPEVIFIAALLQGEAFVRRTSGIQPGSYRPRKSANSISDFEEREDTSSFAALFSAYQYIKVNQFSPNAAKPFGLSLRALRELDKSRSQLQKLLQNHSKNDRLLADPDFLSRTPLIEQAVVQTFPERICQRLGQGTLSARFLGNRKGKLEDSGVARSGTLFIAAEIQEIQGRDTLTHLSYLVQTSPENLTKWFPEKVNAQSRVILDEITNKIVSQKTLTYTHLKKELIIQSEITNEPPDNDLAAALLAKLIHEEKVPLPKWDEKVDQWIARLNQLATWMPELELPSIKEEDRLAILEELCQGSTRIKEVKLLDPWNTLQQWLNPMQQQALNAYAPTEITLSNGKRAKIKYADGEPPTISMKLQHLYDVKETPTLCNGTVLMRVEILAPNQRPWQITSDLPHFWESGYPQMKKDLAGRYPKHEWR